MSKLIHEINDTAENLIDLSANEELKFTQKVDELKNSNELAFFLMELAEYWKLIRLALKFVKLFTGPKADAKIDKVIEWGDNNLL